MPILKAPPIQPKNETLRRQFGSPNMRKMRNGAPEEI